MGGCCEMRMKRTQLIHTHTHTHKHWLKLNFNQPRMHIICHNYESLNNNNNNNKNLYSQGKCVIIITSNSASQQS